MLSNTYTVDGLLETSRKMSVRLHLTFYINGFLNLIIAVSVPNDNNRFYHQGLTMYSII